jgi:CheY-like chemotaxis protein
MADDDPVMVRMLGEFFQAEGYQVFGAFDGQMAIQMAQQLKPDLMVLDVNMPALSGLKVFQYLRALPETASIPVIFVTAESPKDVRPVIQNAPHAAHLMKPVDFASLKTVVQQLLKPLVAVA